jgi:hypothetical protein
MCFLIEGIGSQKFLQYYFVKIRVLVFAFCMREMKSEGFSNSYGYLRIFGWLIGIGESRKYYEVFKNNYFCNFV